MNLKKSFATALIAVIAVVTSLFPSFFSVKAEGAVDLTAQKSVLESGYTEILAFMESGGVYTSENVDGIITVSSQSLMAVETIKSSVSVEEYNSNYRNAHTDVLRVCKNAHVWKMENGYDASIYSPTDGGIVLVHNKLYEYSSVIQKATEYGAIFKAYCDWLDFIGSSEPSLKMDRLSSSGNVSVDVISNDLIFAEDDKLSVSKFLDTVIIKNTADALVESDKLLSDDSGIAYYLSLRWIRNGVVMEGDLIPNSAVTVVVNLKDLKLGDAEDIQLARYLGQGKVEYVEANVVDGNLVFDLDGFGNDVESDYALDFAIVAKGYAKKKTPIFTYVIIGVSILLVVFIVLQITFAVKRRRRKKEYKSFVKQRKSERKNKTNDFEE